jgi:hypothetical protein
VAAQVLSQAKVVLTHPPGTHAPEQLPGGEGADKASEPEVGGDTSQPNADFKGIDRSKWKEILSNLDPDDFKYRQ